MGAQEPYLYYDPPAAASKRNSAASTTREFDSRTLLQSTLYSPTRIRPPPPPPPVDGHGRPPPMDFNKHPDSYLILPYGNTNVKPMRPRTRKTVTLTRKAQLFLRCLQLLGAIGLVVCVICVRKIEETLGWTLRVPPVIAIVHCVYAIYHLARRATGRTLTSTASYMLFATAVDGMLLPFYVFAALTSRTQYVKTEEMAWKSVFDDPAVADRKVVLAVFLLGVINGGLHVVSLVISLFLALVFRKIAKLPPDMNPLEDNLTSRHKRHAKNRSDFFDEKRASRATVDSTISQVTAQTHSNRSSQAREPLIQSSELPAARSIPFMHTRGDSTDRHPRVSRADLPSQYSPSSKRSSRVDLTRSSAVVSPSKRASYYQPDQDALPSTMRRNPKRDSRASLANDNWYAYFNHSDPDADENLARSSSLVSSMKDHEMRMAEADVGHGVPDNGGGHRDAHDLGEQRLDGNLVEHHAHGDSDDDDDDDDDDEETGFYYDHQNARHHQQLQSYEREQSPPSPDAAQSGSSRQPEPSSSSSVDNTPSMHRAMLNPLESNPPTPPPSSSFKPRARDHVETATATATSQPNNDRHRNVLRQTSSSSLNRNATVVKTKLYGDLRPATPPVMVGRRVSRAGERAISNSGTDYSYYAGVDHSNSNDAAAPEEGIHGNVFGPGFRISGSSPAQRAAAAAKATTTATTTITTTTPPAAGGGRTREVSGKVAEEGRAGTFSAWARFRKVSGMS